MAERQLPPVTVAFVAVVVVTRAAQLAVPGWYAALARHPGAPWWHGLTALVAYDDGWVQFLSIAVGSLVLGFIAERRFGAPLWAVILVVCGVFGQAIALFWQPEGAGSSVAVAGWLGAVAAWLAWPRTRVPAQARFGAIVIAALAVWLTAARDIHGPPIVLGVLLAVAFLASGGKANPQPTRVG